MNKLEIAKTVTKFVVGTGASKIVHSIIANNVQPDKITDKVAVMSGSVVFGMMAADASKEYTDKKIDELVKSWRDLKSKTKEAQTDK